MRNAVFEIKMDNKKKELLAIFSFSKFFGKKYIFIYILILFVIINYIEINENGGQQSVFFFLLKELSLII